MDWIPCSERLPKLGHPIDEEDWDSEEILAYGNGKVRVVRLSVDCNGDKFWSGPDGINGYDFNDFTHWMPLPKLPT